MVNILHNIRSKLRRSMNIPSSFVFGYYSAGMHNILNFLLLHNETCVITESLELLAKKQNHHSRSKHFNEIIFSKCKYGHVMEIIKWK